MQNWNEIWSKNKVIIIGTIIFWVFTGLLPRLFLYLDFGDKASMIAFRYADMFIFPNVIGWLFPIFLLPAIKFIFSTLSKEIKILSFLVLLLVAILGVFINNNDDYTLWEINKRYFDSTFIDTNVPELNNSFINLDSDIEKITLSQHFIEPDSTFNKILGVNDSLRQIAISSIGKQFHIEIGNILNQGIKNYSLTRTAYFLSLVTHIFSYICTFLVIGFIFKNIAHVKDPDIRKKYLLSINRTIMAILVIMIWIISRIANLHEKKQIFQGEKADPLNIGLSIMLFVIAVFLVGSLWVEYRQRLKAIVAFIVVLTITIMIFSVSPQKLNEYASNFDFYLIMMLVLVLIGFIMVIPTENISH